MTLLTRPEAEVAKRLVDQARRDRLNIGRRGQPRAPCAAFSYSSNTACRYLAQPGSMYCGQHRKWETR